MVACNTILDESIYKNEDCFQCTHNWIMLTFVMQRLYTHLCDNIFDIIPQVLLAWLLYTGLHGNIFAIYPKWILYEFTYLQGGGGCICWNWNVSISKQIIYTLKPPKVELKWRYSLHVYTLTLFLVRQVITDQKIILIYK